MDFSVNWILVTLAAIVMLNATHLNTSTRDGINESSVEKTTGKTKLHFEMPITPGPSMPKVTHISAVRKATQTGKDMQIAPPSRFLNWQVGQLYNEKGTDFLASMTNNKRH